MNRSERRRKQRLAIKGGNLVAMPTGEKIRVDDVTMRPMPAKQAGRHRWLGIASFHIAEPGAEGPKMLDHNNLMGLDVGCYDCEQPWSRELAETPCPAPESPWGPQ